MCDRRNPLCMTPAEILEAHQQAKVRRRSDLVEALGGEEEADAWEKLYRQSHSSRAAIADSAQTQLDALEAGYTPRQEALIYGLGDPRLQEDDWALLSEAQQAVFAAQGAPSLATRILADSLRQLTPEQAELAQRGTGAEVAQQIRPIAHGIRTQGAIEICRQAGLADRAIFKAVDEALAEAVPDADDRFFLLEPWLKVVRQDLAAPFWAPGPAPSHRPCPRHRVRG